MGKGRRSLEKQSRPLLGPLKPGKPSRPLLGPLKPEKPSGPLLGPLKPEKPCRPLLGPLKPEKPSRPLLEPLKPAKPNKSKQNKTKITPSPELRFDSANAARKQKRKPDSESQLDTVPQAKAKKNKSSPDTVPTSAPVSSKPLPTPKKVLPSMYITAELTMKALKALSQLAEQHKSKNKMFEDEANVFAEINCIKIQNKKGNIRFTLPHSTVASTGEVCLITPDLIKGRKPDHEPTVDHWEEVLRKAGVTQVKTVLPMRQLRVEYDQYELKRRLLTQHDFIMVDTRILNHVSHILGKGFFKKHNMLIPVRLHEVEDIKRSIDSGLKTAILRLNEGQTSTLLVGHMGMSLKEIKENILALVKQLVQKYPGGEQNIRSLGIKLPLSLTLPLYVTLRSKSTMHVPKLHTSLPKQHQILEGELSTIPGSTVKVSPGGMVTLTRGQREDNLVESDVDEGDTEEVEKPKNVKPILKDKNSSKNATVSQSEPDDDSEKGSESENEENNESGEANVTDEGSDNDSDSD